MSWFKKSSNPDLTDANASRYAGKPLLILLENYVLDCIGHLPAEKESTLISAVQRMWGGDSNWKATMRNTLQLDESIDDSLRKMWKTNLDRAKQANASLTPEDFARMIVDENFAHLISG